MTLSEMQMDMLPDRRRLRAQVVAHNVLHILEPWIERLDRLEQWHEANRPLKDGDRPPPKNSRDIYRALFELLYATGVEVITDADRAAAGLDHRNQKGMTDQELRIMERRIMDTMLRQISPTVRRAGQSD